MIGLNHIFLCFNINNKITKSAENSEENCDAKRFTLIHESKNLQGNHLLEQYGEEPECMFTLFCGPFLIDVTSKKYRETLTKKS